MTAMAGTWTKTGPALIITTCRQILVSRYVSLRVIYYCAGLHWGRFAVLSGRSTDVVAHEPSQ